MDLKKIVLVIDNNENDYLVMKKLLEEEYNIYYHNGQEGIYNILEFIKMINPQIILLENDLGKIKGLELLKKLKLYIEKNDIAIIMLSKEVNPSSIVECMKFNADNYLTKDRFTKNELLLSVKNILKEKHHKRMIKDQKNEIIKISRNDDMTGLLNKCYFTERIEFKLKTLSRSNDIVSLAIIDIDNLKLVNYLYGHMVGDEVLKITANILKKNFRETDYISRYGGDEFAIFLIESLENNLNIVANRHIQKVKEVMVKIEYAISIYLKEMKKKYMNKKELEFIVTLSIGIVHHHKNVIPVNELLRAASGNLFFTKENGKNNVAYNDFESKNIMLLLKKNKINNSEKLMFGCDSIGI